MKGSSILITGGSGSFGNAFVEKLLSYDPKRVVIYSRDEHKQEIMARKFGAWGVNHPILRFFIGDVRSPSRLEEAMHGIDTVVHAAALKIVPTAEYNPTECIATNIGGAENVIRAAIRAGVGKALALSTDKAVNPINLYGATKLCAEKAFVAANSLGGGRVRFSVMRYGNVCGSNGSVVPVFRKLLAEGEPIEITDRRMTRFWITMDQATHFAIVCLHNMRGREIFIPKMPSIKITDLARAMDVPQINFTSIRPGEKLHEALISEDEARSAVDCVDSWTLWPEVVDLQPPGWSYTSNNNDKWLTIDQIRETISAVKAPDQDGDNRHRAHPGPKQPAVDEPIKAGNGGAAAQG
jgi:UDP-N-acetylglucosamine 4,6-dehydratase